MASLSLADLISKKQSSSENSIDKEMEISRWQASVDRLINQIKGLLGPYFEQGVKIREQEIEITEEPAGTYRTKRLDVYIGKEKVSIIPRGTFIIGGYGRVDMIGEDGRAIIVLLKKGEKPRIEVKISVGEEALKTETAHVPPTAEDLEWNFAILGDDWEYFPIDENNFSNFLQQVMSK